MSTYKWLFSPLPIKGLTLKNRIVMAPFLTGFGNMDGTVSPRILDHYGRIAQGGSGMVVVEATLAVVRGRGFLTQIRIDNDHFIPGLEKLSRTIKDRGAIAAIQLHHAGRFARVVDPLGPSPVPFSLGPGFSITPRAMTGEEIKGTILGFAQAAQRAKRAGFDMVEMHGATGYLLNQFVSPRTNKRKDEYGNGLEERMRFPLEVVSKAIEMVGSDYPVGYRFMGDEFLPDGFGLIEAKVFARRLQEVGTAYLSVTGGTYESVFIPEIEAMLKKPGCMVHLAEGINEEVDIPVFANGRIVTPKLAEETISSGKADAVALARPLFCDPEFPLKAEQGREREIIKCVACDYCAFQLFSSGKWVSCIQREKRKVSPSVKTDESLHAGI